MAVTGIGGTVGPEGGFDGGTLAADEAVDSEVRRRKPDHGITVIDLGRPADHLGRERRTVDDPGSQSRRRELVVGQVRRARGDKVRHPQRHRQPDTGTCIRRVERRRGVLTQGGPIRAEEARKADARKGYTDRGRPVIGLGRRGGDHRRQGCRRDVCGQAARLAQGVVAGLGAAQAKAIGGDGDAVADIGRGEGPPHARLGQVDLPHIPGKDAIQGGARRVQGGDGGRVVGSRVRRDARDAEATRIDIRGHARQWDKGVVGGAGPGKAEPADRDANAAARITGGKGSRGGTRIQGHRVAGHGAEEGGLGEVEAGDVCTVVGLAVGDVVIQPKRCLQDRPGPSHRPRDDVVGKPRGAGTLEVGLPQGDRDAAGTGVGGIIEGLGSLADDDGVRTHQASEDVVGAGQDRDIAAVVGLGGVTSEAGRDRLGRDGTVAEDLREQDVVAEKRARAGNIIRRRQGIAVEVDPDALDARVDVLEHAGRLDDLDGVGALQAGQDEVGRGQAGDRVGAVVDLGGIADELAVEVEDRANAFGQGRAGDRAGAGRRRGEGVVVEQRGGARNLAGQVRRHQPGPGVRRGIGPGRLGHRQAVGTHQAHGLEVGRRKRGNRVGVVDLGRVADDVEGHRSLGDRAYAGRRGGQDVVG